MLAQPQAPNNSCGVCKSNSLPTWQGPSSLRYCVCMPQERSARTGLRKETENIKPYKCCKQRASFSEVWAFLFIMEPASSKKLMKYDCFLEIIDMNNTIGCSEQFVSSSRDPGRNGGKIEKTLFLQWERATCSKRCDGRRAGSRLPHLLCGHPLSDGALTFSATTAHQSLCLLNVLLWKFSPFSEPRMEC